MTYVQRFPQLPFPELPGKTVVLLAVACLHFLIIGLVARELGILSLPQTPLPTPVTLIPERSRPQVEAPSSASTGPVVERVPIVAEAPELPFVEPDEPQSGTPPRLDPGPGAGPEVPPLEKVLPRQDPAHPVGRPDYPAMSARLGESGVVQLNVCTDASGRIISAEVVSGSGFSRLDRAAVSHMTRSGRRLLPGLENGVPVPMCTEMRMRFGFDAD